jgi:hypothetical protein
LTSAHVAFGRRVAVRENGRQPAFKMNAVKLLAGKARQEHTMNFIPPQPLYLRNSSDSPGLSCLSETPALGRKAQMRYNEEVPGSVFKVQNFGFRVAGAGSRLSRFARCLKT